MKKRILLIALAAMVLLLYAGCSGAMHGMPEPPKLSLSADGYYSGFTDLPEKCTQEEAVKKGYYVLCDLQEVQGRTAWDDFLNTADRGENAFLRIANYQVGENPYFQDIYFQNGSYYYFDSSAGAQKPVPFSYLLTLTGEDGIPKQESTAIILTSERSLTFDDVMRYYYSSSREEIDKLPAFQLLFFRS